jgi:hypothetical protein
MDSSLCVRTVHTQHVVTVYVVRLMSLVSIIAVLVCTLCPWSLLLQYFCAPYVLGRSLLAATYCAPLSPWGNLRGGILLVVG